MKENVARRCDGVVPATDLTEWVQFFRLRYSEDPVPCIRTKRHDARQLSLEVPEAHGAEKSCQITTQGPYRRLTFWSRVYRYDKKDGSARKPCDYRLWTNGWHAYLVA